MIAEVTVKAGLNTLNGFTVKGNFSKMVSMNEHMSSQIIWRAGSAPATVFVGGLTIKANSVIFFRDVTSKKGQIIVDAKSTRGHFNHSENVMYKVSFPGSRIWIEGEAEPTIQTTSGTDAIVTCRTANLGGAL